MIFTIFTVSTVSVRVLGGPKKPTWKSWKNFDIQKPHFSTISMPTSFRKPWNRGNRGKICPGWRPGIFFAFCGGCVRPLRSKRLLLENSAFCRKMLANRARDRKLFGRSGGWWRSASELLAGPKVLSRKPASPRPASPSATPKLKLSQAADSAALRAECREGPL